MKMRKNLLRLDRKGVSLMIGYVLLVIIAIGLSIAVFAFLKLYVPPSSPECPEDVKLTIDDYSCEGTNSVNEYQVSVTLTNRGLFKVYGVYIRMGDPNRIYKQLINEASDGTWSDVPFVVNGVAGLNPGVSTIKGDSANQQYIYDGNADDFMSGIRTIEIEPIYLGEEDDSQAAVCENAIVRKTIICPSSP